VGGSSVGGAGATAADSVSVMPGAVYTVDVGGIGGAPLPPPLKPPFFVVVPPEIPR
jgi:hypothetical protein